MRRPSELKRDVAAFTSQHLRDFIVRWNQLYPIDRWWREKYKVALNSEQHRNTRIIDMRMEWEEDRFYKQLLYEQQPISQYVPGRGVWLKKSTQQQLTNDEIDDIYDKISITDIQDESDELII